MTEQDCLLDDASAYAFAMQVIAQAAQPDPPLWVDEWAEEHMRIPSETGAAEPGPYRVARTPFAKEVMQCLSPEHTSQRVVVMGASQMLKTQTFLNAAMAWIDMAPANIIALMPSDELVKRLSARVSKTIDSIPRVSVRVAKPRAKDARNTIHAKDFVGGSLFLLTAGSAKNLAEIPARYGYYDEVDRGLENVQQEGDPVKLFENRFGTFGSRRKLYYSSSPKLEETSRIKALFDLGDQRRYHVKCPHCGHKHELRWENHSFDGVNCSMVCPENGCIIQESDKPEMLSGGEWVSYAPGDGGETVSFHISALYMPYGWVSWAALAKEYAEAERAKLMGDDEQMQVFYNTRLALPWSVQHAANDAKSLQLKALKENLPAQIIPERALIVTAAVDTQNDRLEYKAIAWGEGMEHWIIDKRIFVGSPAEPDVWRALDETHNTVRYQRADGHAPQRVSAMFIDSGGLHTQDVYNFVRTRGHRGIMALKGSSKMGMPVLGRSPNKVDINYRGAVEKKGVKLWMIGTDTAKDWIAARLMFESGPGAAHFHKDMEESDFNQICAEFRVAKMRKGHKVVEWHKKKNERNEGLDLYVYNLAAAHYLGLHKYTPNQWAILREKVCPEQGESFAKKQVETKSATEPQHVKSSEPLGPSNVSQPRPRFSQPQSGFGRDW